MPPDLINLWRSHGAPLLTRLEPWLRRGWGALLRSPYPYFLLALGLYLGATSPGFIPMRAEQPLTELPLLLLAVRVVLVPLRPSPWSAMAAAFAVLQGYFIHDLHYYAYGSMPVLADGYQVFELLLVPGWRWAALAILILPVAMWLILLDWKRFLRRRPAAPWRRRVDAAVLALATLIIVAVGVVPATVQGLGKVVAPKRSDHELKSDVIRYGRLFMVVLRDAEQRVIRRSLCPYAPIEESELYLDPETRARIERRNVHVIILESFVDPSRFSALSFSQHPLAPEFRELAGPYMGVSRSPDTRSTARSEFEVLCGVPSLQIAAQVEFKAFTGAQTHCLPAILAGLGYATQSSFGGSPLYYNSRLGYRSLGFQRSLFGDRYVRADEPTIHMTNRGGEIYDGDLFAQNRQSVARYIARGQPVLNYLLTSYGHSPFELEHDRHPMIISVEPHDPAIARIANQAYYRTKALTEHLELLREMDPESVVVVVSDHLPPLFIIWKSGERHGFARYSQLGYQAPLSGRHQTGMKENLFLLMDRGVFREMPPVSHFDIPGIILDALSNGAYCQWPDRCQWGHVTADERLSHLESYKTIVGLGSRPAE